MKKYMFFLLLWLSCSTPPPENIGLNEKSLSPCPSSPNCVSTESEDPGQAMAPITYTVSHLEAKEKVLAFLNSRKDAEILVNQREYIRAAFTIPILGFIDDVEFYLPVEKKIIHFRSASRSGYSDLGVNRGRMKEFTDFFKK